jgi:hypothetical protein
MPDTKQNALVQQLDNHGMQASAAAEPEQRLNSATVAVTARQLTLQCCTASDWPSAAELQMKPCHAGG